MNVFPVWWDTAVTVYNRHEDKETHLVKWYRRELNGCFWSHKADKVTVGETALATDYTICRIPKNKSFLERYRWEQLPEDQMSEYFTLGVGDIIVKGTVKDDIDEYVKGKRSTDLVQKFKGLTGCIEITEVSINTGRGRNNQHYFVKGN